MKNIIDTNNILHDGINLYHHVDGIVIVKGYQNGLDTLPLVYYKTDDVSVKVDTRNKFKRILVSENIISSNKYFKYSDGIYAIKCDEKNYVLEITFGDDVIMHINTPTAKITKTIKYIDQLQTSFIVTVGADYHKLLV